MINDLSYCNKMDVNHLWITRVKIMNVGENHECSKVQSLEEMVASIIENIERKHS